MKSAEDSSRCFRTSRTQAPDLAGSQDGQMETCSTLDKQTFSSMGHAFPVDEQNVGFQMRPLKEEPEDEDYLSGGASSLVGHIILNKGFLKNPIKKEDHEEKDYLYCEDCRAFFINECEDGVEDIEWPVQSFDLNATENLWDELECCLQPRPPCPISVPVLTNALVAD
ncbi:hypothetical protein PDJAM_G00247750 [Pangasius djambal]|uniref:Uncharacterized protein n=1 Tax=Pangasius djambal TaxID=1691987 RepID=A0ACC5YIF9_9TELE|nr:hypothetical protein [Pangasius djambal]